MEIRTIQHIIEKVEIQFDLFRYNKLQGKMRVLEKQIVTMRENADELITRNKHISFQLLKTAASWQVKYISWKNKDSIQGL